MGKRKSGRAKGVPSTTYHERALNAVKARCSGQSGSTMYATEEVIDEVTTRAAASKETLGNQVPRWVKGALHLLATEGLVSKTGDDINGFFWGLPSSSRRSSVSDTEDTPPAKRRRRLSAGSNEAEDNAGSTTSVARTDEGNEIEVSSTVQAPSSPVPCGFVSLFAGFSPPRVETAPDLFSPSPSPDAGSPVVAEQTESDTGEDDSTPAARLQVSEGLVRQLQQQLRSAEESKSEDQREIERLRAVNSQLQEEVLDLHRLNQDLLSGLDAARKTVEQPLSNNEDSDAQVPTLNPTTALIPPADDLILELLGSLRSDRRKKKAQFICRKCQTDDAASPGATPAAFEPACDHLVNRHHKLRSEITAEDFWLAPSAS